MENARRIGGNSGWEVVTVKTQNLILQVLQNLILMVLEAVSILMDQVVTLGGLVNLTLSLVVITLSMVVITVFRVMLDLLMDVTITLSTGVNIIIIEVRNIRSLIPTKSTNPTRKRRSNAIMTVNVSSKAIHVAN